MNERPAHTLDIPCALCFDKHDANTLEVAGGTNIFTCRNGCGRYNWDYAMTLSADDPIAALSCPRRRQIEFVKRGKTDARVIRGHAATLAGHLRSCPICEAETMDSIAADCET